MLHARDAIGYLSEAEGGGSAGLETCAKQRGQSQRHGGPRDGGCGWLQLARLQGLRDLEQGTGLFLFLCQEGVPQ